MTSLITDPTNLTRDTEVVFDTTGLTIQLVKAGNLGDEGVTLQCVYSFCKEQWKAEDDLIKFPFPFDPITEEKFDLIDGWDFADATTRGLIRTGGWALKATKGGVSQEEYAGIISLGTIGTGGQVYYQQASAGAATNILLTGAVNQAVKVYGDGSHGNFDYRTYFKIFIREYAKSYGMSQLSDIGVTTMTYQVYRFPLANADDLKIAVTDANLIGKTPYFAASEDSGTDGVSTGTTTFTSAAGSFDADDVGKYLCIDAGAAKGVYRIATRTSSTEIIVDRAVPTASSVSYTVNAAGVSITYYAAAQSRDIGPTPYDFHCIVAGNGGTAEQIYTFIQYMLRSAMDIDTGAGSVIGKTANALLMFVGDSMYTLLFNTANGTFIDDFMEVDTNRLYFADDTYAGTYRQFPFVAVLTLNFGDNLVADTAAIFRVFFTNDDAGTNLGYDYGTEDAILVNSNNTWASTKRQNASGTRTITTSAVHTLEIGDIVTISGLGGSGYNGTFIITATADTTHFQYFSGTGTEAETPDTGGTITQVMGGKIDGQASLAFPYDYDYNVQRGAGSDGDPAPVTVVALGLNTAQFVTATSTINRVVTNAASLVAPLERNYSNP